MDTINPGVFSDTDIAEEVMEAARKTGLSDKIHVTILPAGELVDNQFLAGMMTGGGLIVLGLAIGTSLALWRRNRSRKAAVAAEIVDPVPAE